MTNYSRYDYWVDAVDKYKKSGLAIRKFCAEYNYVTETFRYWLYRRFKDFDNGTATKKYLPKVETFEESAVANTLECRNLIIDNSNQSIYLVLGLKTTSFTIDYFINYTKQILKLDPFSNSVFVFKGASNKSIKLVSYDGNCFNVYKKILAKGTFKWCREDALFKNITIQQFKWLIEGLSLTPKRANYITKFS